MEKFTQNETTYISKDVAVLGNTFKIMQAIGRCNYINVQKITNNPFRGLGKDFQTWDQATRSYKSPEMKTALLMAEIEFKNA